MSEEDLVQAINRAGDSALMALAEWVNIPDVLATISHAIESASDSVKQAQAGIPGMLDAAQQGGNSSPASIQDAIVAVESAVGRTEIAVGEIARLEKIVQEACSLSKDLVEKLKEVLHTAEST